MMCPVNDATSGTRPAGTVSGNPHSPRWNRRRDRLLLSAVVALVVCGATVLSGWAILAHRASEGVTVSWGAPVCQNARLKVDPTFGQMIVARPATRCVIEVRVTSTHPVRVTQLVAPRLGPVSGAPISVDPADPEWNTHNEPGWSTNMVNLAARPGRREIRLVHGSQDAVRQLGTVVSPGKPLTILVPLVWRSWVTCHEGIQGMTGWPRVQFTAWGRSYARSASKDLVFDFHADERTSDCG